MLPKTCCLGSSNGQQPVPSQPKGHPGPQQHEDSSAPCPPAAAPTRPVPWRTLAAGARSIPQTSLSPAGAYWAWDGFSSDECFSSILKRAAAALCIPQVMHSNAGHMIGPGGVLSWSGQKQISAIKHTEYHSAKQNVQIHCLRRNTSVK